MEFVPAEMQQAGRPSRADNKHIYDNDDNDDNHDNNDHDNTHSNTDNNDATNNGRPSRASRRATERADHILGTIDNRWGAKMRSTSRSRGLPCPPLLRDPRPPPPQSDTSQEGRAKHIKQNNRKPYTNIPKPSQEGQAKTIMKQQLNK